MSIGAILSQQAFAPRVDVLDNRDEWTVQEFMLGFLGSAQRYTMKHWGWPLASSGGDLEPGDLALDALTDLAKDFHAYCASGNQDPTSKPLFLTLLHTRIDWMANRYLKARARGYQDSFDDDEYGELDVRTSMPRFVPTSLFHSDFANDIGLLQRRDQLVLALRYFEELTHAEIATILDMHKATVADQIHRAAEIAFNVALQHLENNPPAPLAVPLLRRDNLAPSAEAWANEHYGCDIDAYLAYARAHYRADVSYLVDFIYAAWGTSRRMNVSPETQRLKGIEAGKVHAKLTDDQVRDIRAHSGPARALAQQYNVSDSTIDKIRRRDTYSWVEDTE